MGAQTVPSKKTRRVERRAAAENTAVRDVLNSLRRIVRALRLSSRTAEQRVGLSGAQLFVLQCLARESPCSVNELAARTATDQSSVSVVVSRLVHQGHIRRTTSKTDRRSVRLSLTESGRALVAHAPKAVQDRLILALSALPKEDLSALSALLVKVVEGAEVTHETATLFFEDHPVLVRTRFTKAERSGES